mgnify:CR=1 FL=1
METYDKSNSKGVDVYANDKKNIADKAARIREYRKEASRLAAMANKRVTRLENNGLKDTPAYKAYLEGGGKFGVKGKTYNELQKEVSRLNQFINSATSTIKGANKVLIELANNTGIKYDSIKDLRSKAPKFFELSSKVEQYLRTVNDMASAIGYQKIWEAVNQYVSDANIDLSNTTGDIDSMIEKISNALAEYEQPQEVVSGWYSLKKSDPEDIQTDLNQLHTFRK